MFNLTIRRYQHENVIIEVQVPQRVTITGKEDHFARAYEDAQQIIAGMRALDRALGNDEATIIYDITGLEKF